MVDVLAFDGYRIALAGLVASGIGDHCPRDSDSAVGVLIDATQSMTMPSGYGEQNRWTVAQQAWQTVHRESQRGFGKTRFVPYFFDYSLRPVMQTKNQDVNDTVTKQFQAAPAGRLTDLGTALAELQKQQVDPPCAA